MYTNFNTKLNSLQSSCFSL